jgi:acyl-coenzyme A thioesterase PaaI-like protein
LLFDRVLAVVVMLCNARGPERCCAKTRVGSNFAMSSSRGFLHSRRYKWINFYPPLLGAGIRVRHNQSDDYTITVQLKLTRFNAGAMGTHFGGSLYAMCDPFYALIVLHHLGREYIVWDKAAAIQFLKPGRGTVTATFHLSPEQIAELRAQADRDGKIEPLFNVDVLDERGEVIAKVEKRLYIRRRADSPRSGTTK